MAEAICFLDIGFLSEFSAVTSVLLLMVKSFLALSVSSLVPCSVILQGILRPPSTKSLKYLLLGSITSQDIDPPSKIKREKVELIFWQMSNCYSSLHNFHCKRIVKILRLATTQQCFFYYQYPYILVDVISSNTCIVNYFKQSCSGIKSWRSYTCHNGCTSTRKRAEINRSYKFPTNYVSWKDYKLNENFL